MGQSRSNCSGPFMMMEIPDTVKGEGTAPHDRPAFRCCSMAVSCGFAQGKKRNEKDSREACFW